MKWNALVDEDGDPFYAHGLGNEWQVQRIDLPGSKRGNTHCAFGDLLLSLNVGVAFVQVGERVERPGAVVEVARQQGASVSGEQWVDAPRSGEVGAYVKLVDERAGWPYNGRTNRSMGSETWWHLR